MRQMDVGFRHHVYFRPHLGHLSMAEWRTLVDDTIAAALETEAAVAVEAGGGRSASTSPPILGAQRSSSRSPSASGRQGAIVGDSSDSALRPIVEVHAGLAGPTDNDDSKEASFASRHSVHIDDGTVSVSSGSSGRTGSRIKRAVSRAFGIGGAKDAGQASRSLSPTVPAATTQPVEAARHASHRDPRAASSKKSSRRGGGPSRPEEAHHGSLWKLSVSHRQNVGEEAVRYLLRALASAHSAAVGGCEEGGGGASTAGIRFRTVALTQCDIGLDFVACELLPLLFGPSCGTALLGGSSSEGPSPAAAISPLALMCSHLEEVYITYDPVKPRKHTVKLEAMREAVYETHAALRVLSIQPAGPTASVDQSVFDALQGYSHAVLPSHSSSATDHFFVGHVPQETSEEPRCPEVYCAYRCYKWSHVSTKASDWRTIPRLDLCREERRARRQVLQQCFTRLLRILEKGLEQGVIVLTVGKNRERSPVSGRSPSPVTEGNRLLLLVPSVALERLRRAIADLPVAVKEEDKRAVVAVQESMARRAIRAELKSKLR